MSSHLDEFREAKVALSQLDHTFKIGINGFGSLGRALFCSAFKWQYIDVVIVNDPWINAVQAADILRQDQYQTQLSNISIEAPSTDTLIIQDATTTKKIKFQSEEHPARIHWKSFHALHVIECSGKFSTLKEAARHLHTAMSFDQELNYKKEHGTSIWDSGGAMKVLIAASNSDANRFWPGANEQECMFQDYVIACALSANEKADVSEYDVWNYSRQVLRLLDVVLARDGSVASSLVWSWEGRGPLEMPDGKSALMDAMEQALNYNLPGADEPEEMEKYFMEAANSPRIEIMGACGCCQVSGD